MVFAIYEQVVNRTDETSWLATRLLATCSDEKKRFGDARQFSAPQSAATVMVIALFSIKGMSSMNMDFPFSTA